MGIKRIVDTAFWTDGKVDEFTPEDKYFMLYLLTNPFSKQLGIYEISIKQAAFQLGYSIEAFYSLIDRFENKYDMIRFSKETSEIAIINFLRHSVMKGGKPVEDCIKQDMARVKNKELVRFVFSQLKGKDGLNATVKKIVNEYFNENDIHNDNHNDNDNDNDRTEDESCTNRPRIVNESLYEQIKTDILDKKSDGDKVCEWCGCQTTILHNHHYPIPKRKGGKKTVSICSNCHSEFHSKEREMLGGSFIEMPHAETTVSNAKNTHGEYNHVLLTDEEEEKLTEEYGVDVTARAIIFLDEYIEEKKDYTSDSHYLSIKRWVINAVKEQEAKTKKNGDARFTRYGNFDTNEAMKKALERTYGKEGAENYAG